MRIAVVGAPGSGRTTLVQALRTALQANADTAGYTVTEVFEPEQRYGLVLLMGLDLPHHRSIVQNDLLHADVGLRAMLGRQALAYAVVYGLGQARTTSALQAIDYHRRATTQWSPSPASAWHWNCETCSDAQCEHRLFSALVQQKV